MVHFIVNLPLWQMIRGLGILSYMMLAAGISLGTAYGRNKIRIQPSP